MIVWKHYIAALFISSIISSIELFNIYNGYIRLLKKKSIVIIFLLINGFLGLVILLLYKINIKLIGFENIWYVAIFSGFGIHLLIKSRLLNVDAENKQLLIFYKSFYDTFFKKYHDMIDSKIKGRIQQATNNFLNKTSRYDIITLTRRHIISHFNDNERETELRKFGIICENHIDNFELAFFYINMLDPEQIKAYL